MITISETAANKIKEILKVEGVPEHALRVTASGGSCCGPQYEIMIDDKAGDGDIIVEKDGARLFMDPETSQRLDSAQLSFINDERGEGFVLDFPNGGPGGGCGCGGEESSPQSGGGCGSGGCSCG